MEHLLLKFDQILGQQAAIEALTTAYKLDRLPHGLIFAGPAGVGKATTARALAGLFLCEKPQDLAPCGKCEGCRAFDAGNHPDYHIIYRQLARLESDKVKAKDLSVDVVRDFLIAKAANKTVVGVGKVFLIEEADLMTPTAQNALLKTLEEPAGRALIILLTDQPDALLATIRSRSRLVQFAPLGEAIVREQLQNRGIDARTATAAARIASGSLGLALKWIEDGVIERAIDLGQRLEKIVQSGDSALGLAEWFKSAGDAYAEKQLERDKLSSKDQAMREGLVLYLKLAAQFFRRRLKTEGADGETLERTCSAIDAVVRAEAYLESNVNVALVLQQFTGALDQCFMPAGKA
jgi:DNA polymerase III subunit delta'